MKVENLLFCIFHPIAASGVIIERVNSVVRFEDDLTSKMSFFQAARCLGFINDPWPKSAHDTFGDPTPHLGSVATPQE